jgi:phosphoglycerate dehydrogenase-like enzyme
VTQIQAAAPDVELIHTTRDELDQGIVPGPGADVLLIELGGEPWYHHEVPAEGFAKLVTPRLRWVQACSSGIGHITATGVLPDDVPLTNAAGVHADALGESVMAAVLFHAKRLPERLERQRRRAWEELHCKELRGQVIVVLGTGHIGSAVAARAHAFGMHVVGVRRTPRPTPHFDSVVGTARLLDVLPQADYLVIACPLTRETEGLIGAEALAALRPSAYLINVSRGRVVQEMALLEALATGSLSGAYLDAHAQEPLSDEHPFWNATGVTVIPHDSHSSPYIGDNIVALFTDNLRRYIAGEPLRNLVDRERGY